MSAPSSGSITEPSTAITSSTRRWGRRERPCRRFYRQYRVISVRWTSTRPHRTRAQLDLLKALGDNTRYAIYLELARSSRPLATADIAETLELHPNTVRPHLERMREVGVLESRWVGAVTSAGPSTGTRSPPTPRRSASNRRRCRCWPGWCWRWRSGSAPAPTTPKRSGATRATRAAPFEQAPSTLEALVSDLDRLGFDPVVTDDARRRRGGRRVRQLPVRRPRRRTPDLVCGLHRGLVAGFVARWATPRSRVLHAHRRTPCRVTVRPDNLEHTTSGGSA